MGMKSSLLQQPVNALARIFRPSGEYAGTGLFVDAQGSILTTLYIAGRDREFTVQLADQSRVSAVLERSDGRTELALLRMSGAAWEPFLKLANVRELAEHEPVTILGYSGKTPSKLEATAAGIHATDSLSPKKILLRVDTPPRGLSGAPAIDRKGHVIGILIGYLPESRCALAVAGVTLLAFVQTGGDSQVVTADRRVAGFPRKPET